MADNEELSFSRKVKDEIVSRINSPAKADACLYGVLCCANVLSHDEITLLTETVTVADFFRLNTERICGVGSVSEDCTDRGGGTLMYELSVKSREAREKLLGYFGFEGSRLSRKKNFPKKNLLPQMTAGMFLACGSLSDPNKGYHMEFSLPDLEVCNMLGLTLIEQYDMTAKNLERKNRQILYFKESDNIIDMLALMGATNLSFELTDVKLFKEMRNNINRGLNCLNANIDKSIRASEKQIADIELIEERVGLDTLPPALSEIAKVRAEFPEYSLADLGAALVPPISRSGANHRLQKLAAIAEELRKK